MSNPLNQHSEFSNQQFPNSLYTHQTTYDSFTITDSCGDARDRSFAL
jgi:hypothetical protein